MGQHTFMKKLFLTKQSLKQSLKIKNHIINIYGGLLITLHAFC